MPGYELPKLGMNSQFITPYQKQLDAGQMVKGVGNSYMNNANIGSKIGAPGYNSDNFYGISDQNYSDGNGNVLTQSGWGGLALGVGGLAANWMMGNKQLDFGREQLDFSKDQFYKQYGMQMDAYNRAANQRSSMVEYNAARRRGEDPSRSDISEKYNTGSHLVNADGSVGQTYDATSAFAPTSSKLAGENAAMLNAAAQEDRSEARRDSSRDSNTESNQDEKDKVKKITG